MLRKKLLTKLVRAVTPKKKEKTVYPPMPADPKELAKAMFEVADRNAFGRPHTARRQ